MRHHAVVGQKNHQAARRYIDVPSPQGRGETLHVLLQQPQPAQGHGGGIEAGAGGAGALLVRRRYAGNQAPQPGIISSRARKSRAKPVLGTRVIRLEAALVKMSSQVIGHAASPPLPLNRRIARTSERAASMLEG